LEVFEQDLSKYRLIRIEIADKTLKYYLDNSLIYKQTYTDPLGKMVKAGISIHGAGECDYLRVLDLNGNIQYAEEFNQIAN
jgi:hypothetical protein